MLQYFAEAFQSLLSVQGIIFVVLGSLAGVILGAIPGLGSSTLIVVLLPIAYKMDPAMCMALFISIVIGGMSGGCIGSILLGIPGTSSSLTTVWDGYEFTKKGDPVRPLSAAVMCSFLGTLPSIIIAIFTCKVIAAWAVNLYFWEYAALCYCAILMVVGLSKGNLAKGLFGVGLAIFLASIGSDPLDATGRFVFFHLIQFRNGINLISLMLGLFAGKIIMLEYARGEKTQKVDIKVGRFKWPGKDLMDNFVGFIRSWILGLVIGFMPGLGGPVASIMAYSTENMLAKDKSRWGKGEIMGVISGETAKNSAIGGALIPLIALGIPGDASCVQFIQALQQKNIQPSPLLIQTNPEIVYTLFTAALLSAVIVVLYETIGMPTFPSLLKIPYHYLYSIVIILALTGAYMAQRNFFSLIVMLVGCVLGVLFDIFGVPSLPFLMAFILAPMLENNIRKGIAYSHGISGFFTRPISCALIILGTLVLVYGFVASAIKKGRRTKNDEAMEEASEISD